MAKRPIKPNQNDKMKRVFAFLASTIAALSFSVADEIPDISIDDLKSAIAEGEVILIDVNGHRSYNGGHIPKAINFAAGKEKLADAVKDKAKDTLVVAYCGGPSCGAYRAGASAAKELGFTNIKHLGAGISGWLQAGEDVEKSE